MSKAIGRPSNTRRLPVLLDPSISCSAQSPMPPTHPLGSMVAPTPLNHYLAALYPLRKAMGRSSRTKLQEGPKARLSNREGRDPETRGSSLF